MNKRQKKKLEDKLYFRVRKLHLKKDDIVFMEVNFEHSDIDLDTAVKYYNALHECFPKVNFAMVPDVISLKSMCKKDVYKYLEKIKEMVDNV